MIAKKLRKEEIEQIYDLYMVKDFPDDELKPCSYILRSVEKGYGFTLGIYEGDALSAYGVFVHTDHFALLDYFAVVSDKRGTGIGHRVMKIFGDYIREHFPKIKGIFIETENVDCAVTEAEKETRERRISFYLSCGAKKTGMGSNLFGVEFDILYYETNGQAGYDKTASLDEVYRMMFLPKHYEERVQIFRR